MRDRLTVSVGSLFAGGGGHNVPLIRTDDGIRKLTPRECFNLQGFPGTFTLPSDCSDAQLYKQAGNAVPVYAIRRLAEELLTCLS